MGNNTQLFNPVTQKEVIQMLQEELAATNSEVMALTIELEKRVEERTAELQSAQDELGKTNSELMQLTLELEDRISLRTKELEKVNEELRSEIIIKEETQKALNQKKNELNSFFIVMHDLLCITNMKGYFKLLNLAWEKTLGYTQNELVSKSFLDFVHPEDLPATLETLSSLTSKRENISFINRYRDKDNVYRWLEWHITSTGELLYAVGRDITERKRAEENLRKAEERYRTTLDYMMEGCQIIGYDWRYLYVNNVAAAHGRCAKEKLLDHTMMEMYPGIENTRMFANLRQCMEQRAHFQMENEFLFPNGTKEWFDLSFEPVPEGVFILSSDITARKKAEEEIKLLNTELEKRVQQRTADLAESEERFRQLAEASYEAIVIHDEGVLLRANDQYYKLFGFEPEEMLGKQVIPLTTAPQSLEILGKQIAAGGIGPYSAIGLRKDGTTFPMEIRARGMEYKGRSVRVSAILDISLRMQAEMELHERTTALERANRELEAFSYSVSHDLRAPLRHTNGYVELLVKRYKNVLTEKGQHYLDQISDSVHQMSSLIDDLLQFSRTGRVEMRETDFDMNSMVKEVQQTLCHDNPDRSVEWNIGKLPSVFCDSSLLRLVWINLLNNAVKFTRTRKKAIIEIGANDKDTETIFFVRDNGVGFDMQYAQKLFGVFQRMHPTDEFEGTGIGLANVQRIILRHGGRAWAEAELNKGATFYFSLPKR